MIIGSHKKYPRFSDVIIAILLLSVITSESSAQAISSHPDGFVGRLNYRIEGRYASLASDGSQTVFDRQYIRFDLNFPTGTNFSYSARYMAEFNDSTYHNYRIGIRFYTRRPVMDIGKISEFNADGPVGVPVIDLGLGARFPDANAEKHNIEGSVAILMPVSTHFTFGGGWNFYEIDSPRPVDKYFGSLSWYPGNYDCFDSSLNPDGPEGNPAFRLSGGGSEHGIFGQLDIIIPLAISYTIGLTVRGERVPTPYVRTAILGGWLHYYPGTF